MKNSWGIVVLAFVCALALICVELPQGALLELGNAFTAVADDEVGESTEEPAEEEPAAQVKVGAWVKGSGWQSKTAARVIIGTSKAAASLTKLKLTLGSQVSGSIKYRVYLQGKGWTKWKSDGQLIKSNKRLAIEAVQIKLTGKVAKNYSVYYKVYSAKYGWMGWAADGEKAGTPGLNYNVGALKVYLVRTDEVAATIGTSHTDACITKAKRKQLTSSLANLSSAARLTTINTNYKLKSSAAKKVKAAVKQLKALGHDVSFVMIDLNTGEGVSYQANTSRYIASSIKGAYVAAVCKYSSAAEISAYKSTMTSTITVSSNEGYSALRNHFGTNVLAKYYQYAASTLDSSEKWPGMTAAQLAQLWVANYFYFYEDTNENSAFARSIYTHSKNSVIYQQLGSSYTTLSKPGWICSSTYYTAQNDAGIVMVDGHPYLISIMSNAYDHYSELKQLVQALHNLHNDMSM